MEVLIPLELFQQKSESLFAWECLVLNIKVLVISVPVLQENSHKYQTNTLYNSENIEIFGSLLGRWQEF